MSEKPVIAIAGSGNVAYHLGAALSQAGALNAIFARNAKNGKALAEKLGCDFISEAEELANIDLVICCYSDDSLKTEIEHLSRFAPTVSTSGTVDVLEFEHSHDIGVFYPLQTFSGTEKISFENLPLFVEASSEKLKELLFQISERIKANPVEMSAAERVKLHVTAVFTNNFTNHIIDLAQQFAKENNIDYRFLLPLLDKTVEKLHSSPASANQTGPAKRNDKKTMEKHLLLLDGDKRHIYKLLSESIIKQHS